VTPAAQYDAYLFLLYSAFAFNVRDENLEALRKQAASADVNYRTIQARAFSAPHRDFMAASGRRMAARAVWQEYFRTHDAFLMPTALVPAFPHDPAPMPARVLATSNGSRPYEDLLFWISFATLTGLPATTAPVGFTRNGLPVGIQIMGPWLEDATPIDLAGKLADVVGGFKAPKGF
jgi:amidase